MAARLSACEAELLEVGSRVSCPSCGAAARAWRVALDGGRVVAAADEREVTPGAELRDGLRYSARGTWG